jgi:predicted phosphodiesterase
MPLIDDGRKPYLFNPGSIALPRSNDMKKSYGLIEIEKGQLKFSIKYIDSKNE